MTADPSKNQFPEHSLAVVGMTGRFPGADSVDELWEMLCAGKEGIRFFAPEELDSSISESVKARDDYVRAKGVISDFDKFDAKFFDITPLEAAIMDPQQRLMLELAWAALEHAGHRPSTFGGLIGVYLGMNWNRYRAEIVARRPDITSKFGELNTALANEYDFLATRISYKLNLRGPSVNISTACSTSLVAIAQAAQSLLNYECDMALAGGVSVSVPVNAGYLYQEGGMLSADGHCRAFDAAGTGTTFNDGAAIVVLRRLEDAIEDGDQVFAVIRGFAVNNDGSAKVSYTAPGVNGQADAVRSAIAHAGIEPRTIGLIETHGTATPLGDPIEVAALRKAFSDDAPPATNSCAIGSVKTNVGHLIHAAGVTGFIKAALAVYHGKIPASLHFDVPNPKLELGTSPFYVNSELLDWPVRGWPRRAGVSSFGVGGTNAHVIVEEPPHVSDTKLPDEHGLLCLSAKQDDVLRQLTDNLQQRLQRPTLDLSHASMLYTLQFGRESLSQRSAWVTESIADAREALADRRRCIHGTAAQPRRIGFMFTGQGAQRSDMGLGLREHCPVFREWFERGVSLLRERSSLDLESALFSAAGSTDEIVEQTRVAQPALFLFEFSVAKSLMSIGISPAVLLGHSIGEFAAAALAGVFSFDDALAIVAARGSAMQAMPEGSMVALYRSEQEAREFVSESISIAAVNAPELTVLSGPDSSIAALCETLDTRNLSYKPLRTSHAFHSEMMFPAVEIMATALAGVDLNAPEIPIVSTVTGKTLTDAEATDPGYWARQLLEPVRFAAALETVAGMDSFVLVEVGPGKSLTTLASQSQCADRWIAHPACPDAGMQASALRQLYEAAAACWVNGAPVDFGSQWGKGKPKKAVLPGYPFARTRHWLDPVPAVSPSLNDAPSESRVVAPAPCPDIARPGDTADNRATTERNTMSESTRNAILQRRIAQVFEDASGYELGDADPDLAFSELGFDSLLLTQVSTALKREFGVDITFRELMEDHTSLGELTVHLSSRVTIEEPVDSPPPSAAPGQNAASQNTGETMMGTSSADPGVSDDVRTLIEKQLQLMQLQLQLLGNKSPAAGMATAAPPAAAQTIGPKDTLQAQPTVEPEPKKKQTPGTRIEKSSSGARQLTRVQQKFIETLITEYTSATAASKEYVHKHRKRMSDPRTVSGFTPLLKEMVYPIVTDRSRGSKITDIDGREYIDITNAFGPIFFGHSPDFVTEAVIKQIEEGIETGPQSPLAGEVADLVCELTGNDRVAFANTGSEAVLAALRLARTVTGRDKVVIFEGAYHGIFDEVVVRPGRDGAGIPAAPGIPRAMTSNIIVLPYGTEETLERIRLLAPELAAVMVEPVQSRHPELQPAEFLREVRSITEKTETAFIFDEVVTGFRVHPGGAQSHFDIRADIAVYGKVVGGGYPIGLIGGKARFLDALDGGQWQYGDDSIPEIGVTFFAGTFVRHPLALAACKAVLQRMKKEGPALQDGLARKTHDMVTELREFLETIDAHVSIEQFSSFFYISVPSGDPYGSLLFYLLRLHGIHTWEFRPCFLTTSHSDADINAIKTAFTASVSELVRHGLLHGDAVAVERLSKADSQSPPVEGARLGKDESGRPAWFVADPDRPGKFRKIDNRRAS
jgi:acyl transferase domain-containing protein